MGRCLESPHRIRASCLYLLLFTGSVPRGVFCEQSSQKTRECRREIMQNMISVHREACNCEGTEQLLFFYKIFI